MAVIVDNLARAQSTSDFGSLASYKDEYTTKVSYLSIPVYRKKIVYRKYCIQKIAMNKERLSNISRSGGENRVDSAHNTK